MQENQVSPPHAFGPNPHARPLLELTAAYWLGLFSVAPKTLAAPWLPRAVFRKRVLSQLRETLRAAKADVDFYAEHLAGVEPSTVTSVEALASIPFLTKALLKANAQRMLSRNAPPRERLMERSSSGSSGVPVRVFFDPLKELPRRAQELRLLTAHGFRPWHRQMIFDHPTHLAPEAFLPQKLGLWRREMFPAWKSSEEAVQTVREKRPDVLHGVLSSLRMLALAMQRQGGLGYVPKLIVSKGELLDPSTRTLIESELRAPLVDYYATEETGIIAWQCPTGSGYHVDEDFVFVETVREDGTPAAPGEVGEVVLTNLYMRVMPFIRYRTGDLALRSEAPCACGRSLPLLTGLKGRQLDLIITPDQEIHDPFALIDVMEEIPPVWQFKIEQTQVDRLCVRVRWKEDAGAEAIAVGRQRVSGDLRTLLGQRMTIEVVDVEEFRHGFGQKSALVRGLPGTSISDLVAKGYRLRF